MNACFINKNIILNPIHILFPPAERKLKPKTRMAPSIGDSKKKGY